MAIMGDPSHSTAIAPLVASARRPDMAVPGTSPASGPIELRPLRNAGKTRPRSARNFAVADALPRRKHRDRPVR